MSRREAELSPGAFGDPFRAIDALPGVTPIATGLPYFFLRGAPPGNVGYFLDGIRIPALYHVGLGPAVVQPNLIERVDVHSGGYPAMYGRYVGGIVTAETARRAPQPRGQVNLRALDVGGGAEAPFADGAGHVLVGGRYSYTGLLISLLSPRTTLDYWDYQARVGYDLGATDSVSVLAFGSYDSLGTKEAGTTTTDLLTEFHRVDFRYDAKIGRGGRLRTALLVGSDRTATGDDWVSRSRTIGLRTQASFALSAQTTARFGSDVSVADFHLDRTERPPGSALVQDWGPTELFGSRRDLASGVYADLSFEPTPGFRVVTGGRADCFSSGGKAAASFDPRLATRVVLTRGLDLSYTIGMAHQPPSFVVPLPGLDVGGLQGGLQSSLQSSAGLDAALGDGVTASLTGFDTASFALSDALSALRSEKSTTDRINSRARGSTLGVELLVKRSFSQRLGGFVSYTLSRSTRSYPYETLPSAFDRTHVLNVAVGYDLGAGYRIGGRALFYSGVPNTETGSASRLPSFFRLDLRAEKRWRFAGSSWASLVFEMQNATFSTEYIGIGCTARCTAKPFGPITLPNLGLEVGFQ